ncbi:17783_t:CDS:2, partial [Racocetra fulgida]
LQNTYYRVDKTISKKLYEYQYAGKPRIYNNQNTTSSHIDCSCYINISWPKLDLNSRVTTFEPKHANYDFNSEKTKFTPLYRSLPESIINRIKFYIDNSSGIIFAQALLSDETAMSYTWVFEQLLNANNRILPSVLISDADTGLNAAVKTYLLNVKHIHCIFYLRQNLDRHLQKYQSNNLDNSEIYNSSIDQEFLDINENISHVDITQSSTVLDILRKEDPINDINMIINILEELYETDKCMNETNEDMNYSNQKAISNPYMIKPKGRPRNKRFKSSVEISKNPRSGSSSNFQNNHSNNSRGLNMYSNCNLTSHNIRRCNAPCKLCKQQGYTYMRCKGKAIENSCAN